MGAWSWSYNGWVVLIGVLASCACALPGCFLVLRRSSLLGDAVSHAVLPGIAAAFLFTHSRASGSMFVGAATVGVLTAVLSEWVRRVGRVEAQAALGIVFTSLFALGLILIRQAADEVDLDPSCVLYGSIDTAPTREVFLGGTQEVVAGRTLQRGGLPLPLAAITNGGALLMNAVLIGLCYKELKLASFDPGFADSVGVRSRWLHYGLAAVVAVTLVAAFESVGSILVVAMLVVPGAAAWLLTDRLGVMLGLSLGIAAASAVLGHVSAITVPRVFGFEDTTTAGMMAFSAGVLFAAAALGSPRYGVLGRVRAGWAVKVRVAAEDVLAGLYREEEQPGRPHTRPAVGAWLTRAAYRSLVKRGWVERDAPGWVLTEAGRQEAVALVRTHRLWETYLDRRTEVRMDHLHLSAERLEHVTDPELRRRLAEAMDEPGADPQGRTIPPEAEQGQDKADEN